MKRFYYIVVLVMLVVAVFACSKGYEVNKQAGDLAVSMKMDRNPPAVGENKLAIGLTDAGGKAVTDAQVRVDYSMPAMPGMPPMNYTAEAAPSGTRYTAVLNLSMAGPWNVSVNIARGGQASTAGFNVDVH